MNALQAVMQQWSQFYGGAGTVPNPAPGNEGNAPADPPLQYTNYQSIQHVPAIFPNMSITDIPTTPAFGVDWSQYAVNNYGLSGLEGGGSTGDVPQITNGPTLYFDATTGQYSNVQTVGQS